MHFEQESNKTSLFRKGVNSNLVIEGRSTFFEYLREYHIEGNATARLQEANLVDSATGGPDLDTILPLLPEQGVKIPSDLNVLLESSPEMGAAHEALGNLETALSWYRLGQYLWRADKALLEIYSSAIIAKEIAVPQQLSGGICAARIGERARARQLFTWAADNLTYQAEEEPRSGPYFRKTQTYRAYALGYLGCWDQALSLATEVRNTVEMSAHPVHKYDEVPLLLLPVILAVARYHVDPSAEHRRQAMEMLHPQAVATFDIPTHLAALPYLYALRAWLPELAHPPAREATLPETVWHTARTCRETMAEGGLELDGTPESLKRLDPVMRELYKRYANEPEHRKNLFLMCGSYFGEVIREELAGGQWRLSPKGLLDSTLRWEFGETSYEIWPFAHLRAYLEGQTDKTPYAFWQETEAAFMQCALNARYAD